MIGFCAGGIPQTAENFEAWSTGGAPYIREAQRLGVADAGNPGRSAFLPAYDIQIPGLHPQKKQAHIIHVWSPLVAQPVAIRYAWATSPEGNLKVAGKPWAPLANFRTDSWDYPESDAPTVAMVGRAEGKAMNEDAEQRLGFRIEREAELAAGIIARLGTLGRPDSP